MHKKNIAFWKEEKHLIERFIRRLLLVDGELASSTDMYKHSIQELKETRTELTRLEKLQEDYEYSGWWYAPENQFMFSTVEVHMDVVAA